MNDDPAQFKSFFIAKRSCTNEKSDVIVWRGGNYACRLF